MSNFKKVIEIEKKYDHILSTSKKKYEKEIEKLKEELILNEDAMKMDFISELEKNYAKSVKEYNLEGEKMVKKAKEDANYILLNSKKEDAIKMLLEEVKNV